MDKTSTPGNWASFEVGVRWVWRCPHASVRMLPSSWPHPVCNRLNIRTSHQQIWQMWVKRFGESGDQYSRYLPDVYRKWKPCSIFFIMSFILIILYRYNVNALMWFCWLRHLQNDLTRYMSPRNTRSETMVSCKTSKCIPAGSFDTLQHLLKF